LMTHPGVGPLTALAYVLIVGTPNRFHRGKQIGTYVGLIPNEDSSGSERRSLLKKCLTGPTLLEMSGNPTLLRWVVRISYLFGMSISSYTQACICRIY
jgi:hypothetical protein